MSACATPNCSIGPVIVYRVRPYRTETPLNDDVKRALAWPNVEMVLDMAACPTKGHQEAVTRVGQVVSVVVLSDAAPVTRTVKE